MTTFNMAGIPVDGEWLTFDDVATFTLGKRATKTDGTIPIISSGAKPVGYTDIATHPAGTITISCRGSVGNIYRWEMPIWADNCFVITPKDGVNVDFLYYSLQVSEKAFKNIHDGGLIPRLDIERLKKLPYFLPIMLDQLLLVEIVSYYDQQTKEHAKTTKSRIERLTAMYKQVSEDIFNVLRT